MAIAGFSEPAAAQPTVSDARQWAHPTHTRFVLEMSESIAYEIFTLTNPDRLVIDFPEIMFTLPRKGGAPREPVGVIESFRFGSFSSDTSRVVIDLTGPVAVQNDFILPAGGGKPHRFVLDLVPTSRTKFDRMARRLTAPKPVPIVPRAAADPIDRRAAPEKTRYIIVVDAGHGGVDPGAIGHSGIYEKQITLTAAKELVGLLVAAGPYDVLLTRQDDVFLPLRERVARARRANADLFLSLHADSISRRQTRGAHFYSLSENASDDEAAALAASQNKADVLAGVDLATYSDDVGNILLDLAQRETNNISAEFANTLVSTFRGHGLRILRKAHRQAGFAVLKAPDVPSVLIELGYLSNKHDDAILRTPEQRSRLLQGVAQAVNRHFATPRFGQRQ